MIKLKKLPFRPYKLAQPQPKAKPKNTRNTEAMRQWRSRNLQLAREVRKNFIPPYGRTRAITKQQYERNMAKLRRYVECDDPETMEMLYYFRDTIYAAWKHVPRHERKRWKVKGTFHWPTFPKLPEPQK